MLAYNCEEIKIFLAIILQGVAFALRTVMHLAGMDFLLLSTFKCICSSP